MTHDLLAEPEKCGICRDTYHSWIAANWNEMRGIPTPSLREWSVTTAKTGQHPHTAAQDAAMVQAWRAAAGSENPVAWVLRVNSAWPSFRANGFMAIADELDKLVTPTGGKV